MRPNTSYFKIATSLVTLFVCCQSFGQEMGMASGPEIRVKKVRVVKDEEAPRPAKLDNLIIDLSKYNFDNKDLELIKPEIREGPSSGGGGNSCALMILKNTQEILAMIPYYPPFQHDGVGKLLENKIKMTRFEMDEDLHIGGKNVEALNYPVKNLVRVEQPFCDRISEVTPGSVGTTLHEFLGVAGLDDTGFQVSTDFITYLYKQTTGSRLGDANFKSPMLNKIRAKFQSSSRTVDKRFQVERFKSTCSYYTEVDGESLYQNFTFEKTSQGYGVIEFLDQKTGLPVTTRYVTLNISNQATGIIATLPNDGEKSNTYMVLRQNNVGALIGEWTIAGKNQAVAINLKKHYPVTAISMAGASATAYSICSSKITQTGY